MGIKQWIIKKVNFFRSLGSALHYGGFQTTNISYINYGEVLKGKVVLITGGSKGIGLAIARKFIQQGAQVIITGRNESSLLEAKRLIKSDRLYAIPWDVSNIQVIGKNVEAAEKIANAPIDILVNNAGVYCTTQYPNCTENDWDNVYNTNSKGCFFLCQFFCNKWVQSREYKIRKIINISSQGGFVGANNAYRMTKWDIRGLTKFLGISMSRHGIIVNGIAPGIILTDMQEEFKSQGENIYTHLNPANRLGYPEEIAELALYLASDSSNFVVGQTICCDGGYTLNN